jgi:phosphate starvation-inducible PhoH-like protein
MQHKSRKNLSVPNIQPLTNKQKQLLEAKKNVIAHGSAGTGKTFCALALGLKEVLANRKYSHITVIRSAVETRKIGFLPGNEKEKTEVYEAPYIDICDEIFEDVNAYSKLKNNGTIRFMTTSFIRGTNLRNSFVIIDEYQNMTFHELDSIITRFGNNCKIIFCGDTYQADLGSQSGIKDFNKILKKLPSFEFIDFGLEDIVRSDLVKEYLVVKYNEGSNK